ncbi:ABC transporter ATP-binding protein [Aureibaculum sp. 2210JD6-5]|uniref:ABC transporter ATP-binding protein n=1 Tax=Aureibaculum sp. 2210JD6-5 TaxID=3103957 RepID=UPI002AAD8DE1|nr:ABC transporter ATP-binding protein [Aureibaculum sp. 2210JD6-5]MDY7394221.1 ABC transporter ATP-binding protein [Aureibaculum sp. 2210JD6-5]
MIDKSSNIVLKTNNLKIGYQHKKQTFCVADNINITLSKGQFVCLLGKNGIGKSTLLRTLTKVQSGLGGNILIDNKSLETISNIDLAKKMSLVLTEKIPDSNLNVYEIIALGRQPYTNWIGNLTDNDKTYVDFAIEQTNIRGIVYKKYNELSDGQLQKVMIARALAQNTEIIILDEPTVHLDIQNKVEIFKLLKTLSLKHEKTILISSHEIQLALQLANQLWLMNDEGIISGPTENLIANGSVANLFSSNLVTFDAKSKQFIINPE